MCFSHGEDAVAGVDGGGTLEWTVGADGKVVFTVLNGAPDGPVFVVDGNGAWMLSWNRALLHRVLLLLCASSSSSDCADEAGARREVDDEAACARMKPVGGDGTDEAETRVESGWAPDETVDSDDGALLAGVPVDSTGSVVVTTSDNGAVVAAAEDGVVGDAVTAPDGAVDRAYEDPGGAVDSEGAFGGAAVDSAVGDTAGVVVTVLGPIGARKTRKTRCVWMENWCTPKTTPITRLPISVDRPHKELQFRLEDSAGEWL
jgi:hypothetical protein